MNTSISITSRDRAGAAPGVPQQTLVGDLEQRVFRTLLDCMSRPGTIGVLPQSDLGREHWRGALVVLQSLLDHEVTFCVEAEDTSVQEQILRRTGARTAPLSEAGFVLTDGARARRAIEGAREGDLEAPERSATVVVAVSRVGEGRLRVTASGPGIATIVHLALTGVGTEALVALRERNSVFPGGIDVVLVDPEGRVACLPRSTRIELED